MLLHVWRKWSRLLLNYDRRKLLPIRTKCTMGWNSFWCSLVFHKYCMLAIITVLKGGFYSEGTDAFVISSNKRTLFFFWAWILNLWCFKGLKLCQIKACCSSEEFKKQNETLFEPSVVLQALMWHDLSPLKSQNFKIQAQQNNKVCMFQEMANV